MPAAPTPTAALTYRRSPSGAPPPALGLLGGGAAAEEATDTRPTITALEWDDDPYSVDLAEQFRLLQETPERAPWQRLGSPPPLFQKLEIASSVGSFVRPNRW